MSLSSVSVCMMCRNEIDLLPAYYRFIKQFANEWCILDHGSDDGSIEFIEWVKRNDSNLDVKLRIEESFDFGHNFWGEWNKALSMATKDYILRGFPDEFIMPVDKLIKIIKSGMERVYFFERIDLVQLQPSMYLIDTPKITLFPNKKGIAFKEYCGVHCEIPLIPAGMEVIELKEPKIYHLNRCRNFEHIRFKELCYEKCSGFTILTSKYSEEKRNEEKKKALPIDIPSEFWSYLL